MLTYQSSISQKRLNRLRSNIAKKRFNLNKRTRIGTIHVTSNQTDMAIKLITLKTKTG